MAILLLIILVIVIGNSYVNSSNIEILTKTKQGTDASTMEESFSYPSGFNSNNCIVVACEIKKSDTNNWMIGSQFNSGNSFGSFPYRIVKSDSSIQLQARNIILNDNSVTISNFPSGVNYTIKLVLMKIS